MNIVNIISFLCGLFGVFAFFFDHSDLKITLGWKALCIVILVIFYRNWGGFRAKQALMHLSSGSFQLDDFQFVLILEWGAIFMAPVF